MAFVLGRFGLPLNISKRRECFSSLARFGRLPSRTPATALRIQDPPCSRLTSTPRISVRWFTPMTKEEEDDEKTRVQSLTSFQKDQELRKLNRQLAKLEMLKGINTGELYTWGGRYKQLARDYGMPMFAYYWVVWTMTAGVCYVGINVFQVDSLAIIAQVDGFTGWDLSSKVDPEMGKIGMAILLNEILEPIRLPAVILTVKPVMDNLFPPKF